MNKLDIENIFTFQQYTNAYLAKFLGKDPKTIYNYRDNIDNIPYGKILQLEKLIKNESTNIANEPPERYKPAHEYELLRQIEKLNAEKELYIRTINEISAYNIELQNHLKNINNS